MGHGGSSRIPGLKSETFRQAQDRLSTPRTRTRSRGPWARVHPASSVAGSDAQFVEGIAQAFPGGFKVFRENAGFAHGGHEIGVAGPAGKKVHVEMIGDRPAAVLEEESVLMQAVRAADRHLNLGTEQRIGSTDANIPLSMGIPAVAIGTGGVGGNIHTLQEWYEPVQRETALRRILLVLLAVTQVTAQRGAAVHSVS